MASSEERNNQFWVFSGNSAPHSKAMWVGSPGPPARVHLALFVCGLLGLIVPSLREEMIDETGLLEWFSVSFFTSSTVTFKSGNLL